MGATGKSVVAQKLITDTHAIEQREDQRVALVGPHLSQIRGIQLHRLVDETHPVGNLSRGTRYSVLRVPVWHDEHLNRLERGALLDFAMIWDEDHERVIEPIQMLYLGGLLPLYGISANAKARSRCCWLQRSCGIGIMRRLTSIAAGASTTSAGCLDDPWSAQVDSADGHTHSIIHSSPENVATHLKNIDMLWQLGVKPKSRMQSG